MSAFDPAKFRAIQDKEMKALIGDTAAAAASVVAAVPKPKPKAKAVPASKKRAVAGTPKNKAVKRAADDADLAADEPRRSSRRNPARGAKLVEDPEELRKHQEEQDRIAAAEAAARDLAKHGDRPVEAREGGVVDALGQDSLIDELRELALYDVAKEDGLQRWELGKRPPVEADRLRTGAEPWDLRAIVKIIPDRIYSMTVHPDPDRDIVFAGDKTGHIALWDCTDAGRLDPAAPPKPIREGKPAASDEDDDEDDGPDERVWGKWWHWKAHQDQSVSFLKFRPGERKTIYSSSYDGTLRATHFDQGTSEEVLDATLWSDNTLLHSFDFDPTGNELWASDDDGGLIFRDMRQAKKTATRWQIDGYKVGCISINPANPTLAATAHLKRYMALWDLSALRGLSPDTEWRDVREAALVTGYESKYACSSAYFDPTGTRLASTSYDDQIRVWDVDPHKALKSLKGGKAFDPKTTIVHNTQVGRYVTVLRAHWSQVPTLPPHLHVGNMHRTLSLFSPAGTGASEPVKTFEDSALTAVPAVTAAHPTREGRYYGGAASGKVSLWAEPRPDDE
ncbi:hypothetical protein JCM3770_003731 [Rhodotorula araucariae]